MVKKTKADSPNSENGWLAYGASGPNSENESIDAGGPNSENGWLDAGKPNSENELLDAGRPSSENGWLLRSLLKTDFLIFHP